MSRSSWIKPSVKKLIADEAIRNPKESRLALHLRCKREIEALGEVPPSEETAYKLISEARRTPHKFDQPWTMASLKDNPLPPDSVPWVLRVWRYAASTGEKFSLGHAEWTSRLYPLFTNITLLWFWSNQYAYEERLALVLNEDMDTFILDSNLVLTPWQRQTLLETDFREKSPKIHPDRFIHKHQDGHIVEELLHAIEQINFWKPDYVYNQREHELSDLIRKLPSLHELGFTEEAIMVYLRWFTYLTKGPKWKTLSPEHALATVLKLRQISREEQQCRISHDAQPEHSDSGIFPRSFFRSVGLMDSHTFHSDLYLLLQKVGHRPPSKEDKRERSHKKKSKK